MHVEYFNGFRIKEPGAAGRYWGLAALAPNTNITLGTAGGVNQNWILQLVS